MKGREAYNSVEFAKYMIMKANERSIDMNMTKTQKLLYIAYGAGLVIENERLLNEHPQAWPYGPVFPTTRNKLLRLDFGAMKLDDATFEKFSTDERANRIIDFVFLGFKLWTASQLTAWSHEEGSPWDKTTHTEGFKWGDQIPDTFIQDYFKGIIVYE